MLVTRRKVGLALLGMAVLLAVPSSTGCGQEADTPTLEEPVLREPVEAILELFDRYSVVGLGEGSHGNWQGATFRLQLIRDPRFPQVVDDILVEFGAWRYQDLMDRYVAGEHVPLDSVRLCWRETTQPVIWDTPVYEEFFRAVRALNQTLPERERLRILLGDPPIDWTEIRTPEGLRQWHSDHMTHRSWGLVNARDGHAVNVIEREVLTEGRKVLALFGDQHFSRGEIPAPEGFVTDYLRGNIAHQLDRLHPGSFFSITTLTETGDLIRHLPEARSWPRPAFFYLDTTSAASQPSAGPVSLEDRFDGALWLGPEETISYSTLLPDVAIDRFYYEEAMRRDRLWLGQYQDELTRLRKRVVESGRARGDPQVRESGGAGRQ